MFVVSEIYLCSLSVVLVFSTCSGYIAPEYALRGHISVKSDVFSFGILVLEIVSGKKIMGLSQPGNDLNLLGYVSISIHSLPCDDLHFIITSPFFCINDFKSL